MKKFKQFKFYNQDEQQILEAVSIFKKLGYRVVDGYFNINEAKEHGGVCVWDDGEITSGWLADDDFEQVTLEDLKEMVGGYKEVLWLNKNTLEEKSLESGSVIKGIDWVKVPEGATFATGDKDDFVFRKDGWYYDNQKVEWVETNVLLKHFPEYKHIKLFWVKGVVKDNIFTLERLLGCEVFVNNDFGGFTAHVVDSVKWCNGLHVVSNNYSHVVDLVNLTFFTEDGDEVTFDEYVQLYYPKG